MGDFEQKKDTQKKKKLDAEEFAQPLDASKYKDITDKIDDALEVEDTEDEQRVFNNCVCWGDFGN